MISSSLITKRSNNTSIKGLFLLLGVFINAIVLKEAFINQSYWYTALFITLPLLIVALVLFKKEPINKKQNSEGIILKESIELNKDIFNEYLKNKRTVKAKKSAEQVLFKSDN